MSLQPKPAELTAKAPRQSVCNSAFCLPRGSGLQRIYEVWSKQAEIASIETDVATARTLADEIGKLSAENRQLRERRGRLARRTGQGQPS